MTSPINGRVSRNYVDVGNLVGSGEQTLLTRVVRFDPIYVYSNVSESLLIQCSAASIDPGSLPGL